MSRTAGKTALAVGAHPADFARAAVGRTAGQEHLREYRARVARRRGVLTARGSDEKITHGAGHEAVFPHVEENLA